MKQILVGIDGSAPGSAAADWAAERARDFGLQLNLVHAVPEPWAFREDALHKRAMAQAMDLLGGEEARLRALFPSLRVVGALSVGEPAESMRTLSAEAGMVVVGTDRRPDSHGEGFGSVSFQIAIISHCPVAVIPAPSTREASGVVVGVDGSSDSGLAVDYAAREAFRMGQELTLVHACGGDAPASSGPRPDGLDADSKNDGQLLLSAAAAGLSGRYPGLVVNEVLDPRRAPAEALVDAGSAAKLLVIGCKGRGGQHLLVGSVAQSVLLDVRCPTLLTRPA
ncbi:universal stress protein [Arthrobacter sp. CJ23]|uniref:universal stress protein n=1 Tax=Arthrobacter sp. CJ23 TaxID=2972479 RepID=UPI00215BD2EE|nr:universal stress protein [Arthrobacter sp. CJ23]UVJ41571.1 universal stress protein [Arthrobacter sp. CJ23]